MHFFRNLIILMLKNLIFVLFAWATVMALDPYRVLKVSTDATERKVTKAYQNMLNKYSGDQDMLAVV